MKLIRFTLMGLLGLAFILKPQPVSQGACVGWDEASLKPAFQFFAPLSFEKLYDFDWEYDKTLDDNLSAWLAYFQNKPKVNDIRTVLYEADSKEVKQIVSHLKNANGPLPSGFSQNTLLKYLKSRPNPRFLSYLEYALACEKQAQAYDSWSDIQRDPEIMRSLRSQGLQVYKEVQSDAFLKVRYAYQVVRMSHYLGEYQAAVKQFQELLGNMPQASSHLLYYWALSHKAGALYSLGAQSQAAYLFSQIFEDCPSKRASSFLSFKVTSDTTWRNALALCQNEEEKAQLYFMRSLQKNSNIREEMKSVYQLAPSSEKLSIMLAREINRLENNLLRVDLSENLLFFSSYREYPRPQATAQLMELKELISQAREEKKIAQPNLWQLADAYLEFLLGSTQRSLSQLAKLKKNTKDKRFLQQIALFETAMKISQLNRLDARSEDEIYKEVKATGHEDLMNFMIRTFARKYKANGQKAKAYLCTHYFSNLKVSPRADLIDELYELATKTKTTSFEEEYLLPRIQGFQAPSERAAKHILLEIKATMHFAQDQLKLAKDLYDKVPAKYLVDLPRDPFEMSIGECISCHAFKSPDRYNRKTLVQRILYLKELLKKNPVDQEKYYYQLGAVYYNMSHFGNAWYARDYFRSGMDLAYYKNQQSRKEGETPYMLVELSQAKYYFDRAMSASIRSGNPEMAAQSCYMAAKCEQKQYYLDPKTPMEWSGIEPDYNPENRRYFQRLQNEFKDTQYYLKVIEECQYFNEFIKP